MREALCVKQPVDVMTCPAFLWSPGRHVGTALCHLAVSKSKAFSECLISGQSLSEGEKGESFF